jgi:hypothetical protein
MTPNADYEGVIEREPTVHAYYRHQGFESCPDCGEWIATAPHNGRSEP